MSGFFSNMKIAKKLPIMMVCLAVVSIIIVATLSTYFTINDSYRSYEDRLLDVTSSKKHAIETYFDNIEDDLIIMSESGDVENAVIDFTDGWNMIEGNPTDYLAGVYRPEGTSTSQKMSVEKANDGSVYSEFHETYHAFFKEMLELRGYYDIFLLDDKGNVIYTVTKEPDYATNMLTGKWQNTGLATVYKDAIQSEEDQIAFADFASYAPSHGEPVMFMATPVTLDGKNVGVLAFQLSGNGINEVLGKVENKTDTKTVLLGQDGLYRNDPYKNVPNSEVILKEKIDIDNFGEIYAQKQAGLETTEDNVYRYDTVNFAGTRWMVVTMTGVSEIMGPIWNSQYKVWSIILVIVIIISCISIVVARTISKPLGRQVDVMGPLSEGNYAVEVPDQNRGDEVGDIARAVQTFKENGLRMKEMEAEQEMQKQQAEREKRDAQLKLANDFDGRVGGVIARLSNSAESMTAMAQQMQIASQQTTEISATVASSAAEADSNVQTVAAAAEELSASSSEIARQIDAVAKKASSAADDAQETSVSVKELNVLADSIGEVIGTIKDIAEQTNLLALNATIEAARAGEAGKGFAVVADEVKKLANETATKTEEIDERVNRIQEAIRNSVTAMDKIISNVSEIDAATTTVASAVEEQNAATSEIGRNVTEASTGTQQVSSAIMQVQQNASESGDASTSVLNSATDLKSQSDILKEEVEKFLNEIRGAEAKKTDKPANDPAMKDADKEAAE